MPEKYICRKRAKISALCGEVNIPYGTELTGSDGFIFLDGSPVCSATSQNAFDHFCSNDDGNGLERGKLIALITDTLASHDKNDATKHQARWNKIWADDVSKKYKRRDHVDYWLWDADFFNAPIEDLRHIANVVKGV